MWKIEVVQILKTEQVPEQILKQAEWKQAGQICCLEQYVLDSADSGLAFADLESVVVAAYSLSSCCISVEINLDRMFECKAEHMALMQVEDCKKMSMSMLRSGFDLLNDDSNSGEM